MSVTCTGQLMMNFQVQVKTLGYVGLGISPNGGMAGADIVTAWVKDDLVYFQVFP